MLAGMTCSLVQSGARVHAIARTTESLEQCAARIDPALQSQFTTQRSDYADEHAWTHALEQAHAQLEGPVDSVICWIHSSAPSAFDQVLERFPNADVLRVLPSRSTMHMQENLPYRTATLGFEIDTLATRWLTHAEISSGIYSAFRSGQRTSIVGTLRP